MLCASRRGFAVGLDLGTGSGRNLLPLLLAVRAEGFIIASDLAPSGLLSVEEWLSTHGAKEVERSDLIGLARDTYEQLDFTLPHKILLLKRCSGMSLDPLRMKASGDETIYLVLVCASMEKPFLRPSTVDLIVNRGSIFYLPPDAIPRCVSTMHHALRPGGTCLVSFKSEHDSRFQLPRVDEADPRVRVSFHGAQSGLALVFSDQVQVRNWMADFYDLRVWHLETHHPVEGDTLADWIAVGRKKSL